MALLSAIRNATKAAIQPADKIANCEIDCVLLLPVVLVSMKVKDSRKRVMVAASVAAPNISSDFFLSVDLVCCCCGKGGGDVVVVVVVVIQSNALLLFLQISKLLLEARWRLAKLIGMLFSILNIPQ